MGTAGTAKELDIRRQIYAFGGARSEEESIKMVQGATNGSDVAFGGSIDSRDAERCLFEHLRRYK